MSNVTSPASLEDRRRLAITEINLILERSGELSVGQLQTILLRQSVVDPESGDIDYEDARMLTRLVRMQLGI